MSSVPLLSPILNGGIQNINFVNGRVLTAEDLTAERKANLQRQRLLGVSIGSGIASGFEVTRSSTSKAYGQQLVTIKAGLAVNRNGDTLQLTADTDVTLAATLPTAANDGGLFAPCLPPQVELTNPGVYILTVMPASGYQQQVAIAQLNSAGVATSCSSRFATAGLQFRLAPVTLPSAGTGLGPKLYALGNQIQAQLNANATPETIAPAISLFRNGLAHLCFGTETLATYAANPFPALPHTATLDRYGLIDEQRDAGLITNCEVPLAILYWSLQGIQFVDLWPVRRNLIRDSAMEAWPFLSGQRRVAEGIAIFQQFQDHLSDLLMQSAVNATTSVAANNYFYYLPAAGFLPLATSNGVGGFNFPDFFSNRTYREPVFMEGTQFEQLFRTSFLYPPIDLSKQEMLWLYRVHENQVAIDTDGSSSASPYLVFTNGQIEFQGKAKYDLNCFNYANYF